MNFLNTSIFNHAIIFIDLCPDCLNLHENISTVMHKFIFYLMLITCLNACINPSNTNSKKNREAKSTNTTTKEFQTNTGKIFRVHTDYSLGESICMVQIETQNFENNNATYDLGNLDPVQELFLADLDQNGYEEIYIVTQSAGSGSYSNIYGISSNSCFKRLARFPAYILI